jgi:predicted deacylase
MVLTSAPTEIIPPTSSDVLTSEPPAITTVPTGTQEQESVAPTQTLINTGNIGKSFLGRSIDFTRIGNGPQIIVIAGALHGTEPNAANLVDNLSENFENTIETIQGDFTFYFLPRLNPDGLYDRSRYNANGVDLNRNWDTSDWRRDAEGPSGTVIGSGGNSPFSEPETGAFSTLLLDLNQQSTNQLIVLIYHSAYPTGLVQPSYRLENLNQITDTKAASLAQIYANHVRYNYSATWTQYSITGEAIHWCADHAIICIDIELPSSENLNASEVQDHILAIMGVIQE